MAYFWNLYGPKYGRFMGVLGMYAVWVPYVDFEYWPKYRLFLEFMGPKYGPFPAFLGGFYHNPLNIPQIPWGFNPQPWGDGEYTKILKKMVIIF